MPRLDLLPGVVRRAARVLLPVAGVLLMLARGSADARAREPSAARFGGLRVGHVSAGSFTPLYRPSANVRALKVAAFWLMTEPVTNAELLAFVAEHPEYRRDRIARVFADAQYLVHWEGATQLGPAVRAAQPVTHVSWFVASAFCAAHGMRLPSEAEWELAAAASSTHRDGRVDASYRKRLLDWYTTPRGELPDVPHDRANLYGIHDLHGVIWEWVEDFNNSVVVEDSGGLGDATRFCGTGALSARDTLDYAAFMRVAMRGSLEASYTGALLGFRCAADHNLPPDEQP